MSMQHAISININDDCQMHDKTKGLRQWSRHVPLRCCFHLRLSLPSEREAARAAAPLVAQPAPPLALLLLGSGTCTVCCTTMDAKHVVLNRECCASELLVETGEIEWPSQSAESRLGSQWYSLPVSQHVKCIGIYAIQVVRKRYFTRVGSNCPR